MDIQTYLRRIGFAKPVRPDFETLRAIHRAHMLSVPFENLDIIPLHRPIHLDEQALWNKIVVNQRGGFCYELNGIFAWLLKQIGFEVIYLNARVFNSDGTPGKDFDHLTLLVRAPDGPERWLADVGFGDSFTEPLSFEERGEQVQGLRAYKLEGNSEGYVLWQRDYNGQWNKGYFFDLQPRNFPTDYEAACLYHQTSPQTHFTRQSIISRATPAGRVSLEEHTLILTENGKRRKLPVEHQTDFNALLKEYFGVVL